jgi:hypothetical protein
VLFDLEPGVIDAIRSWPLGELLRPGNLVNKIRARETAGLRPIHYTRLGTNSAEAPKVQRRFCSKQRAPYQGT